MFYSQFILAKKGPLGTIWIAAHLERKLRKNQVADTDIGVSVDSILCPEVPIALRLSSHLLLGVVRIYSRKVNYLFDDCSEALLKIKQAFRSTAVDLPPEESKAPYHSITLPETFDLDDFELPDNDIFQGNYVDHHTSTREQITLQDNMEGVVFSTSQFGLDERFGDGEAPGLNLDEELFLHKVDNAGHAGESADHQSSAQAATPKPDEGYGGILSNPETRIGNLNLEGDLMDYAQAPCTPGLVETPNLANIQEISACEDHMDDEDNPLTERFVNGNSENISSEFSHRAENAPVVVLSSTDNTNSIAAVDMLGVENGNHLSELETEKRHSPLGDGSLHMSSSDPLSPSGKSFAVDDNAQALGQDPKLTGMTMSGSTCLVRTQELEDVILKNADVNHPSVSNMDHGELNGIISKEISGDASCSISLLQVPEGISDDHQTAPFGDKSKDMEVSGSPCRQIFSNGKLELSVEDQCLSSLEMPGDNGMSNEAICDETTQVHILRPCSTGLGLPDSSVPRIEVSNDLDTATDVGAVPLESSGGGEMIHASGPAIVIQDDKLEHDLMENYSTEPISVEDSHAVPGKLDNQVNNVIGGDDMMENISSPVSAVFPAPEKLLSVPDEHNNNQPRDLLLEATPGDLACVDESDAGSRIISGKKRSYTESTLTEQSLNSVESARIVRTKRTAEAIPDDDDLLSSILVGRRSSVLKVKPTPPPSEITSTKRQRQAPRASASKRKVLMDDTMVLHGDTIRQQLTTTEDIRRLRKKAPCTRPEISIIMKQFLEDEIFSEPLFSGVSVALASLFNQGCDLSRIKISKGDAGAVSLLSLSDMKSISANETIENATGCAPAVPVENDVGDCGELAVVKENFDLQPAETTLSTENKLDENHELCTEPIITEPEIIPIKNKEEAVDPNSSLLSPSHNFGENEIGDTCAPSEAVGVAQLTTPNKGVGSDDLVEMEATVVSSGDIREAENVTLDASVVNGSEMNVNDERFDTVKSGNTDAATEVEPKERDGFVLEGTLCADTVETERYVGEQAQADVCGPSGENEEEQAEACGPSGEKEQPQAEACGPSGENEQSQPEACGPSGENELVQSEACGPSVENEQVQSEICGPSGEIETDTSRRDFSEPLCGGSPGGPQIVTPLYPSEFGSVQGSFLDDNEYLIQHEGYPPHVVGADIDMQDYNDFNYSAAANDTEFLNVDDDEVAEVTDDYVPDADETRFMEKSGWSSRTRAVANYLQTMFLKEAEYDRKVLPMDNLLSGKTRKEASRMFFETLVLKTRDYIHVEQECPHQNINIKPKMKLLKTEF